MRERPKKRVIPIDCEELKRLKESFHPHTVFGDLTEEEQTRVLAEPVITEEERKRFLAGDSLNDVLGDGGVVVTPDPFTRLSKIYKDNCS